MLSRSHLTLIVAITTVLAACNDSSSSRNDPSPAGAGPVDPTEARTRYSMANACFLVQDTSTGRYLNAGEDGGMGNTESLIQATPFFMKPSGLGRYLFYDPQARFLSLPAENDAMADAVEAGIENAGWHVAGVGDTLLWAPPQADALGNGVDGAGDALAGQAGAADNLRGGRSLAMANAPSDAAEWTVDGEDHRFTVSSTLTGDQLGNAEGPGIYDFIPAEGCLDFPEAELNASGEPFKGTNPDGTVFGYAETHMHLGGSEMLGGRMSYGSPFHRFGITHALGNCEGDHGPNGVLDGLDTFVNAERQFPPHDTVGWPTYKDWPSWGGQTHHQTYYVWLQRAWMGGLRLMVNHFVANEELCQLWPVTQHDCNEMESIALQYQLVHDLQDYIDAQFGGPGEGFFRIVTSSAQARSVIEEGKMAVILGTENEKVFDCGEYLDQPLCTREHIDEQLDQWYDMGLRAIFPIHLLDNAFGGTRLTDDPALNALYQTANIVATGHPYATIPCEQVDSAAPHGDTPVDEERGIFETLMLQVFGPPPVPPASECYRNARGLTALGDYFINAMIDRGMMIETDHTGVIARRRMFDTAEARGVPVFSGHTGEVGPVKDSRRILEIGGIISNLTDEPAPATIAFMQDLIEAYKDVYGTTEGLATGHGSDINGIHNQPPPREDASENPLEYPFTSYDGNVVFERQVTGERVFDLNLDGVAHYGLYPDYIADIQRSEGGEEVLQYFFRSAEAYLQRWEQVEAARIGN